MGWGGGRGASIRKGGVLLEWGRPNTNYTPQGGRLLDMGRLFESGCLLDHLW